MTNKTFNEEQTMERLKTILIQEFELDEEDLTPTASLYDELGLDSLDSVDLIVALEKEFKFKVVRSADEPKILAIRQLSDLYDFIREKHNEMRESG